LDENHRRHILAEYVEYNNARTHQSLDGNSPVPRDADPPANGRVVATPYLGGLHHRCSSAA